jgi:hypothetical protein
LRTRNQPKHSPPPDVKPPPHTSGEMCWLERQYPNCPLCGGVGEPQIINLECPFDLELGDCNYVFETTANILRAHPTCVELDRIAREVHLSISSDIPPPSTNVDQRSNIGPLEAPAPTSAFQSPQPSDYPAALPATWTAQSNNNPSHAMALATHRRDELLAMANGFIPIVSTLETTIGSLDPHLARVIHWISTHIAARVGGANRDLSRIQAAEFDIANNPATAQSARQRLAATLHAITIGTPHYESAMVWHRRYTDLFIHLRRLAGQLSPPRHIDDDELPSPFLRRRGAIAGLDDPEPTAHTDFLPPPGFYLDDLIASDDEDEDYVPGQDEDVDMDEGDS